MASSRALTRATGSTQFLNLLRGSNHSRAMASPFTTRSTYNESSNNSPIKNNEEENPFQISGPRGSMVTKSDEEGIHFRVDMPGVRKNVKVWVEKGSVFFRGRAPTESEHEEKGCRSYGGSMALSPAGFFKTEDIKADMQDGVFRMFIPRNKDY